MNIFTHTTLALTHHSSLILLMIISAASLPDDQREEVLVFLYMTYVQYPRFNEFHMNQGSNCMKVH